ncbi:TetR family transcriptional regulator [Streptomyces sp. NPDC050560]|uniref:TetR family transcriptional regulator n=1 Tax=Streptomyces sp. NPDC050560 TaxID=3365630 RepID=UPI0037B9CE73
MTSARTGLRERKKRRTRDALLRAALELFVTQGFEETTVDEIVEAVGVSQRTFFRYFAGKEDAAFAVHRLAESSFMHAVRERPGDEGPLEAMRGAVVDSWDTIERSVAEVVPLELYMRMQQLIESTPALLASLLRRSTEQEDELVRVIADREGLDPEADARPYVLVGALSGVLRLSGRRWSMGDETSLASIRRITTHHIDQLGPALAGRWRGPAGAGTARGPRGAGPAQAETGARRPAASAGRAAAKE